MLENYFTGTQAGFPQRGQVIIVLICDYVQDIPAIEIHWIW